MKRCASSEKKTKGREVEETEEKEKEGGEVQKKEMVEKV